MYLGYQWYAVNLFRLPVVRSNFIMDSRTGLGRFKQFRISNYDLMMRLIEYCRDHTIDEILALPDDTTLYLCHDYKAPGRDEFCWQTTVAEQKASNVHVGGGKTEEEFVSFRTARDAQLSMPKLIIPSIQVNMRAGQLPPAEEDGEVYLKVPINKL